MTDANRQSSTVQFTWHTYATRFVPDVMGFSRAAAVQTIEQAGLVAAVTGKSVGVVTFQSPLAGDEVAQGSTVRVIIKVTATSPARRATQRGTGWNACG